MISHILHILYVYIYIERERGIHTSLHQHSLRIEDIAVQAWAAMSASGRCDTTFAPCIHQLHGICLERMIGYDNLIGHFLRDFGHLLGRNIETCVFPTPSVTDARPGQTWFVRGYCTRQKWSYPMVINHCNGKKNIHIAPFNCTFSPGIFQVREFPSHELTPSSLRPVSDGTRFGQLAVDGFDSFETYLRKKHVFTFTISG